MNFDSSKITTPPQNLRLNDNTIQILNKTILLGVILTIDLKWNERTSLIYDKVNSNTISAVP